MFWSFVSKQIKLFSSLIKMTYIFSKSFIMTSKYVFSKCRFPCRLVLEYILLSTGWFTIENIKENTYHAT